ncbi:MAG: aminopeptidase P family protein [Thermoplasmata archaeon]
MRERVLRIFQHIEKPMDAIVIMNGTEPHIDRTFFYVTSIHGGLFEGCVALLHPDGTCRVLSSRLEADIAQAFRGPVEVFATKDEREAALRSLLADSESIGINGREITYSSYAEIESASPEASLTDVSEAVIKARQVKDDAEVKSLRRACEIAVEAFEELLPYIQVGRSEAEIAAELTYLMQRRGASGPSFTSIVASGANTALPHYATGERRLQDGDLLLMDFGALYEGYASDMTRTIVLGAADGKQRRIYEVVLEAQQAALDAMKAGVDGQKVYEVARNIIDSSEFKDRFTHGLGHTIGLAVHDGAAMRASESLLLEKGMAMTVEPGVYLPGFGGVRIEDDVLITDDGVEVLTPATRELLEI